MKLKILKTLLLMSVLSGCSNIKKQELIKINLPELPNIQLNIDAEKDFQKVCTYIIKKDGKEITVTKDKCSKLDKYLAEMYAFRIKYDIYKEELAK